MINIVLNFILVTWCGPLGAAIATAVSYGVVWGVRLIHLRKYIRIRIKLLRDCAAYGILVAQSILLLLMREETLLLYGLQLGLIVLLLFMFLPELKGAVDTLRAKVLHRGRKEDEIDEIN